MLAVEFASNFITLFLPLLAQQRRRVVHKLLRCFPGGFEHAVENVLLHVVAVDKGRDQTVIVCRLKLARLVGLLLGQVGDAGRFLILG